MSATPWFKRELIKKIRFLFCNYFISFKLYKYDITSISWPIQAKWCRRKAAHTIAHVTQNGETPSVKYDTAPSRGTLTYVFAACSNNMKLH